MDIIGRREIDPRLAELYRQKMKVYSISKANTIDQCEYQAFRSYLLKDRGLQSCYSIMGSRVHGVLENIMNDEATEKDLLPALNQELKDVEMLGLDFPKDFKGNDTIRDNWTADMTHFCNNFTKPKGDFITEELMLIDLGHDRWVQGYIDLIKVVDKEKKIIDIIDWKTSSDFSKEDLLHHGRQLVLYGMSKEQEGYTIRNIGWYMLKYIQVDFLGYARVNSKEKTQLSIICNRGKLFVELKKHIERDLIELGYDELDIEVLMLNAKESNLLEGLPKTIKENYKIKPFMRKYEYTNELKNEVVEYLNKCADVFESKGRDEAEWIPRGFTRLQKSGKEVEDTFFCHMLCGHRKTCPHIKKFDDMKDLLKVSDEDLF